MLSYKELGLVNTKDMFAKAIKGGYAIPAYNFNNMEQMQAIIQAAVETKSPVILQVSKGARAYANKYILRNMARGAVEYAKELALEKNGGLAGVFTAGTDFMHIWQNEMDIVEWEKRILEEEKCQTYIQEGTFVLAIYRILWAEYLEYVEGGGVLPFNLFLSRNYHDEEEILLEVLDCTRKGNLTCYSSEWGKKLTSLILRWRYQYSYNREGSDFLLLTIYRRYYKYHTCSEMILLFKSLVYFDGCKRTCDNLHLFFQYIRGKNHFYMQLLQANQIEGLANFRYSYSKMLTEVFKKNDKESQYDDIFKCIYILWNCLFIRTDIT